MQRTTDTTLNDTLFKTQQFKELNELYLKEIAPGRDLIKKIAITAKQILTIASNYKKQIDTAMATKPFDQKLVETAVTSMRQTLSLEMTALKKLKNELAQQESAKKCKDLLDYTIQALTDMQQKIERIQIIANDPQPTKESHQKIVAQTKEDLKGLTLNQKEIASLLKSDTAMSAFVNAILITGQKVDAALEKFTIDFQQKISQKLSSVKGTTFSPAATQPKQPETAAATAKTTNTPAKKAGK